MSQIRSSEAVSAPAPGAALNEEFRERILKGALRSIARYGLDRSSIASIARESAVSRQTVYAYYGTREDVLRDAVTRSATELTAEVIERARGAKNAGEFLVELTVGAYYGVREDPAISAMLYSLDTAEGRELTMSAPILDIVVAALQPILEFDPTLEPRLGVIAETCMRMQVSLLTFPSERTRSPEALRSYLSELVSPLTSS